MIAAGGEAGTTPRPGLSNAEWRCVAGIGIGLLLGALDGTIIATALPRIAGNLDGGASGWSWLAAAYLFGSAISIPAWGAIGDARGHKRVLVAGFWLLLLSSMLCAVAGSGVLGIPSRFGIPELALWRFAQGVGSGAVFTGGFSLIAEMVSLRRSASHAGGFGLLFAVATLAGPLLGGLITEGLTTEIAGVTVAGWRFIFILQLPVTLLALALARQPGVAAPIALRGRFDFAGLATIAILVLCITVALSRWGEWLECIPWIGGAAAAAALLAWIERRTARPLLPPALLAERTVRSAALAGSACSAALLCLAIGVPGVLQLQARHSPTQTGLAMAALTAGVAVGALAGGRWLSRTGDCRTTAIAAIGVSLVGLALLAVESGSDLRLSGAKLGLIGIGFGPLQSVFGIAAQHAAPDNRHGAATALVLSCRRLGAAGGAFAGGLLLGSAGSAGIGKAWAALPLLPTALVAGFFLLAGLMAAPSMSQERLPDE